MRVTVQHACDLVKRDACTSKHIGDFWHGAGGAIGQPFPGHAGAITHGLDRFVIDRSFWLQVEHNDRGLDLGHGSEHRARDRIGGGVQKNQIHLRLPKRLAGGKRFVGVIHHAQVDHLHIGSMQALRHLLHIAFQPLLQAVKLWPVGVQTDAEQTDFELGMIHG